MTFRPTIFSAAAFVAIATAALGLTHAPASAARPANPVVVELFQSQGCSSCPPADANVNAIAARPDVLALSFGVTYWDDLGWKDTFASPRFTARQWDYAHHAGRAQVGTPQVIVNGGPAIVGNDRRQLDATIARAGAAAGGPALSLAGGQLHVAAGRAPAPATLWLVRYDPRVLQVPIRAGENGGRTIAHRNIVRDLVRLGDWHGAALTLPLPAGRADLARAVFVQQGTGGPITAALKL